MTEDGDGDADDWDAATYDGACAFVADEARDLVDLLDPTPGERIADIGCGTGTLTREIADAGADVVGVDRSRTMVARARRAHPDLTFVRADAEALPLAPGAFDAVFSNATLHWVGDQDAALASIREALVPGGRFVAEFGGSGNVAAITDAVETSLEARGYDGTHPWHFPTPGAYATRLEDHGFEVRLLRLFDRPTPLSGGEDGLATWLEVFGSGLFAPLDDVERGSVVAEVENRLREDLFEKGPATVASGGSPGEGSESDGVPASEGSGSSPGSLRSSDGGEPNEVRRTSSDERSPRERAERANECRGRRAESCRAKRGKARKTNGVSLPVRVSLSESDDGRWIADYRRLRLVAVRE